MVISTKPKLLMKNILFAIATSVLVVLFAGCGKPAAEPATQTQSTGQAFNAVQYMQDFASASPELQALATQAYASIQRAAFSEALKTLGQLEANPALNDAQKNRPPNSLTR